MESLVAANRGTRERHIEDLANRPLLQTQAQIVHRLMHHEGSAKQPQRPPALEASEGKRRPPPPPPPPPLPPS